MKARTNQNAGFTMVEVMIVVLIIAILGAVAIPQFTMMTARTKRVEAVTMLHGIDLAQRVYMANYDTFKSLPNLPSTTLSMVFNVLEMSQANLKSYNVYGPMIFGCSLSAGAAVVSYCIGLVGNIDSDAIPDVLGIHYTTQGCSTTCSNKGPNGQVFVHIDDLNL